MISPQTPKRQKLKEKDQLLYDVHKRFYSAIILSLLTEETPIIQVANKYGVARGQLQSLQTAAASFSGFFPSSLFPFLIVDHFVIFFIFSFLFCQQG